MRAALLENSIPKARSAAAAIGVARTGALLVARCGRRLRALSRDIEASGTPRAALDWLLEQHGIDEKGATALACDKCKAPGAECEAHDVISCAPCARDAGWRVCVGCKGLVCPSCCREGRYSACDRCGAPLCSAKPGQPRWLCTGCQTYRALVPTPHWTGT